MSVRMIRRVVILVVRVIGKIGQRNICFWEPLYWKIISKILKRRRGVQIK